MSEKRWRPGRPGVAGPDFEKLYRDLLFQLNHRITGPAYSIQGIISLDLSDQEKLELIRECTTKLDAIARDISRQYSDFNS
jgi:hypothetical protein